jgi:hypothetical protein
MSGHQMNSNPVCPVCENNHWEKIGTRTYSKQEIPGLSEYARIRYEVLFDVWLPDRDRAEFTSILCGRCGFLAFAPRPDGEDIERKYRFLAAHPEARAEAMGHASIDRVRSAELFGRLADRLPGGPLAILDYGGGTGGMMQSFAAAGHECWVVDYVDTTLPGIRRLGATLDEIPEGRRFDVIICSHVLEHLADFVGTIRRLSEHLSDQGMLYVEVPLEVWDGAPLPEEPVTHVNFFTLPSLRIALQRAGLAAECAERMATFESGERALAITALCRRASAGHIVAPDYRGAAAASRRLIRPPVPLRWQRFAAYPEVRRRTVSNWGRRYLPRTFFWRFFD